MIYAYLYNRIGILYLFRFMSIFISACRCEDTGSIGLSCDGEGRCQCKDNFDGNRCEKCKEGFYNYPICEGSILCYATLVLNVLVWCDEYMCFLLQNCPYPSLSWECNYAHRVCIICLSSSGIIPSINLHNFSQFLQNNIFNKFAKLFSVPPE